MFSEENPSSSGCTPAKDDETAVSANNDEAVVEEHPLLVAQVGDLCTTLSSVGGTSWKFTEYQLHELPTASTVSLFMLFYRLELARHRLVLVQPGPSR